MRIKLLFTLAMLAAALSTSAQFGKLKGLGGKKDTKASQADTVKTEKKGGGPGLWNKVVTKAAKVAANLGGSLTGMVSTTDNLAEVAPSAVYVTNLHPASVGVVAQSFYEGWEAGGSNVTLSFTKKNAIGFFKIDGDVLIDGKPANYASIGVYGAFFKDNATQKQVSITTKSGQKASFTIQPPKQSVKLISINGQKENATADLTKELVLELSSLPAGDKSPVLVWLTGSVLGLKTFYEVGWFAPGSKITIPAAMFRNMNGVNNNINFKDTYLQVSRGSIDKAAKVSGAFPDMDYGNMVTDGKFITVTGSPAFNKGITAKAEEKFPAGEVSYEVKKANALFSPNFARMKNLAVTSFAIQGTTSYYDKKDNKLTGMETTKTATFPQMPDAVWDNILNKLYPEVTGIIQSEFGVNVLPIDKVTGAEAYRAINAYSQSDKNTESNFSRAYKDTKLLLGLRPISEMSGRTSGEYKLMKETGANAIMRFTFNLDINFEGAKAFMTPKLAFEISGEVLGETYNTAYLTGTVTGKGIPYKKEITAETLESIILRRADMISAFRKAMQDIKAKEKANGDYDIEWAAMTGN